MNRPRLAAAAATIVLLGATVAAAQALTAPAGTPDLSQMTLQRADLGPANKVSGGYVKPPKKVLAQYDRNFVLTSSADGTALAAVETQILLADRTSDSKAFFRDLRLVYGSNLGHSLLAAEIEKAAGKVLITRKDIHFGKLHAIGVAQQSLLMSITLRAGRKRLVEDVFALRIGAVIANVSVIAIRPRLADSVPTALATTIAAHVTAVLAAAGSSGPTGATGATGSTGATGASG